MTAAGQETRLQANRELLAKMVGTWRLAHCPVHKVVQDDLSVSGGGRLWIEGSTVLLGYNARDMPWRMKLDESSVDKIVWAGVQEQAWIRAVSQTWRDFVVILSHSTCEDGFQVVGRAISGKQLTSVCIREPAATSWLQFRFLMSKDLQPQLSKSKLKFVTCLGRTLTLDDDQTCMDVLLTLPAEDALPPGGASAEDALPPGWKSVTSKTLGVTYFSNKKRGISTWDKPRSRQR